jgi:hypothetical protein
MVFNVMRTEDLKASPVSLLNYCGTSLKCLPDLLGDFECDAH